jgi:large subunit ribosomal protein L25
MAETLEVKLRDARGKHNTHRLRNAGQVPAILYGHSQETVCLSLSADVVDSVVRHGTRLVNLTGAISEQAFIRECQWDTWGNHVLHVDFTRVSEHEQVSVRVALELRGEAPGAKMGGVVNHLIHEVEVRCEAASIPEKLTVNINELEMGESIKIGDVELPAGASISLDPQTVVVQCVEIVERAEDEGEGLGEVEPEVIGRKKESEEESDS